MSITKIAKGNGGSASISVADIEQLKKSLRGEVIQPDHKEYDDARTIWNAMIDRKPALIVRCAGVADVIQAVKFASANGLLTAIHGAGHNIAGNAVCDDGLMIDLSRMKSVSVDPEAMIANVEPGALLGDVDHETQAFGCAVPVGINSTTGISGLTLGGGFGWLSRKHGMTVDSLKAVDIVTAKGEFIQADKDHNSDLFWAACGGGGNFGVVTRFKFKLHKVGTEMLSGLIVYPIDEAKSALKQYREYSKSLTNDTSVWVVLRKAPPLPFLPENVHGKEVLVFAVFHLGDPEKGKKAIEPIRSFGNIVGEHTGVQPFMAWQSAFDALLTPGARNYWKTHNFTEISDEVIDLAVDYTKKLPSDHCEIFFAMLGGEAGRNSNGSTAYSHRDANFIMNVHGRWEDAADDEKCIGWSRKFFKATAPFATGGAYINFMTAEEEDRVQAAYGKSYDRLKEIKRKYDPENLFRMNQNVNPKS